MLLPAKEDEARRHRLWVLCASPLFDICLDEETWEEDYRAIGEAAHAVGYTTHEVGAIYWNEVVPAIVGSWGPIDFINFSWLEKRCSRPPRLGFWLSCLLTP